MNTKSWITRAAVAASVVGLAAVAAAMTKREAEPLAVPASVAPIERATLEMVVDSDLGATTAELPSSPAPCTPECKSGKYNTVVCCHKDCRQCGGSGCGSAYPYGSNDTNLCCQGTKRTATSAGTGILGTARTCANTCGVGPCIK